MEENLRGQTGDSVICYLEGHCEPMDRMCHLWLGLLLVSPALFLSGSHELGPVLESPSLQAGPGRASVLGSAGECPPIELWSHDHVEAMCPDLSLPSAPRGLPYGWSPCPRYRQDSQVQPPLGALFPHTQLSPGLCEFNSRGRLCSVL